MGKLCTGQGQPGASWSVGGERARARARALGLEGDARMPRARRRVRVWVRVVQAVAVGCGGAVVCGALGAHAFQPLVGDSGSFTDRGTEGTFHWAVAKCLPEYAAAGCPEEVTNDYGQIADWNTSLVTNMYNLFLDHAQFNVDISRWDVSSVTTMQNMFYKASAFNAELSAWDVGSVTDMRYMFADASAFKGNKSSWKTDS